jgi:hypothetical protein
MACEIEIQGAGLQDVEGPTATDFCDVTYDLISQEYVTNINAFTFAGIPLNDVLNFDA